MKTGENKYRLRDQQPWAKLCGLKFELGYSTV
jgi:hypothetical protein